MEKKQLKAINDNLATFLYTDSIKEIRITKVGKRFEVNLRQINEKWDSDFI